MNLKFDLPESAMSCIKLEENEKIYYSVPYDIADDGSWLNESYFVVTNYYL